MARPVEDHGGDRVGRDALGLGQRANVFVGGRVKVHHALRIARTDRDLVHVDIGRVQQRVLLGHRQRGNGAGHVLGAERGALQRIDGNIHLRPVFGADFLADEQHRRLVHFALADDDGTVDGEATKLASHGVDGRLVGLLFSAAAAQPRRGHRGPFGDADDFERENALKSLLRPARLR